MANESLAELQKAAKELRDGLKGVDEDIKKLTGRDPSENQRSGTNRRIQLKRTPFQRGNRSDEPLNKQRRESDRAGNRRWGRTVQMGSRFSKDEDPRLDSSGEEDDSSKPAIQSVVAAEIKPVRLQNKAPEEDKQVKSRNRRMFGLLIGTLQKFKDDTQQKTQRERKREEIEKKLEKKAEEEKQELSNQRRELFQTRKQKQIELKNLERKMDTAVLKEEVASHNEPLENFIKLKTKPYIFYLPSKHNDETLKLLEESKASVQELQNARFRDLDLDADDFGFGSFNKGASNGKRLLGRAIDVKDVSHRDLFEEERQQDEVEREGKDEEKSEIQGAEERREQDEGVGDEEMREEKRGDEGVRDEGMRGEERGDEGLRDEGRRKDGSRDEDLGDEEMREEGLGEKTEGELRGEKINSEETRSEEMDGEMESGATTEVDMRGEVLRDGEMTGNDVHIEDNIEKERSTSENPGIDSSVVGTTNQEYAEAEISEQIEDKQMIAGSISNSGQNDDSNVSGEISETRMVKSEQDGHVNDSNPVIPEIVDSDRLMAGNSDQTLETYASYQEEPYRIQQTTELDQNSENHEALSQGHVDVQIENNTVNASSYASFMPEINANSVIPGLDLISGYQEPGY